MVSKVKAPDGPGQSLTMLHSRRSGGQQAVDDAPGDVLGFEVFRFQRHLHLVAYVHDGLR